MSSEIPKEGVQAVGDLLIQLLKSKSTLFGSDFFNDNADSREYLIRHATNYYLLRHGMINDRMEADEAFASSLRDNVQVMLQLAAANLQDIGVVDIEYLQSTLPDGEMDFKITVTETGTRMLWLPLDVDFHNYEFTPKPVLATDWLSDCLEQSEIDGSGAVTLNTVMDAASNDPEVLIVDGNGKEYDFPNSEFASLFEVALWNSAKRGMIVPVCESEEQERMWANFEGRLDPPPVPNNLEPHPFWNIPFRLAKKGTR